MGCIFTKPSPEQQKFDGEDYECENKKKLNLVNYIRNLLFGNNSHQQLYNESEIVPTTNSVHQNISLEGYNNNNNKNNNNNNNYNNNNIMNSYTYESYGNSYEDDDEYDEMPIPTIVAQPQQQQIQPIKLVSQNQQIPTTQQTSQFLNITGNRSPSSSLGSRHRSKPKETLRALKKRHKDGHKMVNEYVFVRKLGKGTFGKVKLAYHHDTHHLYAIKIFNKIRLKKQTMGIGRTNAFDDVLKEIAIMKKMNHINVVKLYEVINDPQEEYIYIVMEYIEGGSIMSTNEASEDLARKYFRDIVFGLEYLHEQKVIHKDLKPENLLVNSDGVVKITDFGVSHIFDDDDFVRCSRGSPAFLAPELCRNDVDSQPISGKGVDVWALGVSLYCLIFARTPFVSKNNSLLDIYDQIVNHEPTYPRQISNDLMDLFKRLLDKNPLTRIQIAEIKTHKWTTIDGTWPMNELDHLILSVTDQEMIDAISTDHTIKPSYNTTTDEDDSDLSNSSGGESSGITGSSNESKPMYNNVNSKQNQQKQQQQRQQQQQQQNQNQNNNNNNSLIQKSNISTTRAASSSISNNDSCNENRNVYIKDEEMICNDSVIIDPIKELNKINELNYGCDYQIGKEYSDFQYNSGHFIYDLVDENESQISRESANDYYLPFKTNKYLNNKSIV
ncbi:hypothetical protein ACTFIU_000181 [Dictyostelium citrinum]